MTQYIDKAAVVTEIKKRIKYYQAKNQKWGVAGYTGRVAEGEEILDYLDTLEVKEADLEKKINREPSLPSNLDEAAENYYEQDCPYDGEARVVNREHDVWFPSQAIEDAFKAGAEWMASQLK